ncbi:MAG: hypothetical protein KGD64_02280 [Candidatus Heimdallarchaeota archaeon]|nr:hypothetical protein [Candidatus Heimdallarchaeota archaeon]
MPDIPSKEKYLIKLIAEKYSKIISRLQFKNGSLIYQKTYNQLYKKSARWKFCLLCGKIDYSEDFKGSKHACPPLLFQKYPLCCSTSWIQLKEFFLLEKYLDTLSEVGVEVISEQ